MNRVDTDQTTKMSDVQADLELHVHLCYLYLIWIYTGCPCGEMVCKWSKGSSY